MDVPRRSAPSSPAVETHAAGGWSSRTTVVPVSDSFLTTAAELRHACRRVGHALHEPVHANDLWIAASAVHIGAPLLAADAVFGDVPGLDLHR